MHRFAQNTVFPLPDPPAIPTTVTALDAPGGAGGGDTAAAAEAEVEAARAVVEHVTSIVDVRWC